MEQTIKKLQLFKLFARNLEIFAGVSVYHGRLEGSTIFSLAHLHEPYSVESSRLADPRYAVFSSVGRQTKKSTALELRSIDYLKAFD